MCTCAIETQWDYKCSHVGECLHKSGELCLDHYAEGPVNDAETSALESENKRLQRIIEDCELVFGPAILLTSGQSFIEEVQYRAYLKRLRCQES